MLLPEQSISPLSRKKPTCSVFSTLSQYHTVQSVNNSTKIITGRNEVVAKVMFLLVSVILLTGRGVVCLSACWDTTPRSRPPPGSDPPPRGVDSGIRSMSGRYASCWNAFLLEFSIHSTISNAV